MDKSGSRHAGTLPGLFLAVIILLSTTACGYRFSVGQRLGKNLQTISVSMLDNRTAETGIENIFTNDLIFEFTKNGSTVTDREAADAVLSGTIDALPIQTVAYRGQLTSVERRITAVISLRLSDPKGDVIWSANGISRDETYGILSEKVATDYNKREAIKVLSRRLAEDVYDQIVEKF